MSIYVAGHGGMVGSAILKALRLRGHDDIVTRTSSELDLTNQAAVVDFFSRNDVQCVYLAAARVGGIRANSTFPADFAYENLMIECNVIHAAFEAGVQRLLFLGSSCIYPRKAPQPMPEESLLQGALEPTNEPYAIAKIAGIKLCESYNRQFGCDFRSVMPTNLYGPNDNFHPINSHVVPALIRRFHEARSAGDKRVTVWGSGKPRREFLYVDDMADACLHVMGLGREAYDAETEPTRSHINVGCGTDVSIRELSELISQVVGFDGDLDFDKSMPDGAPRKLLDVTRIERTGWRSGISLGDGLEMTYEWFLQGLRDKTVRG